MFRAVFITIFLFISSFSNLTAQSNLFVDIDCGGKKPDLFLIKGESYRFENVEGVDERHLSIVFGNRIVLGFNRIEKDKEYVFKFDAYSDDIRKMRISADGNEIETVDLKANQVNQFEIKIPSKSYAYGQLVLVFDRISGSNAVISNYQLHTNSNIVPLPLSIDDKKKILNQSAFEVNEKIELEGKLPFFSPKPNEVYKVSSPVISLNGTWLFNQEAHEGFYQNNNQVGKDNWSTISVPGQWSMQGFIVDSVNHKKFLQSSLVSPELVSDFDMDQIGFAAYQKSFVIPRDWNNSRKIIRFDGVHSECTVWLNGRELGSHLGGMTPFEFEISDFLIEGENILSLKVRSETMADLLGSLTQYAAHQIGGITRKVEIFAVPNAFINDLGLSCDLDKDYVDAKFKVDFAINNIDKSDYQNLNILINIPELGIQKSQKLNISKGGITQNSLLLDVKSPELWTNETPKLYKINIALRDGNKTIELIQKKFGFREVAISGDELLVNGISVKLRGVNRHEVHPLKGRSLDVELWRKDVELFREANCNFIRTSHYPPAEEFIEICDELGMFVEVESPICWVGHHANKNWQKLDYTDNKWFPYMLQANLETIQHYKNHPSVIFWSMANESFWSYNFAKLLKYVELADNTRPHAFHDQAYGGFNNFGSVSSIANMHYPGPRGAEASEQIDRPLIFGEYVHLNVYNRRELVTDPGVRNQWQDALAPMWESMYHKKGVLGGAIWSGIDDVFILPNQEIKGYGPWGPIDGWRRKKPEWYSLKKIYSPIRLDEIEIPANGELKLKLENRYSFISSRELKILWQYGKYNGVVESDIMPGQSGRITINLPKVVEGEKLFINIRDPRGFDVDQFVLSQKQIFEKEQEIAPVKTSLKEKKDRFEIVGKKFKAVVYKKDARLTISKDKVNYINNGPWLMALPLDGGVCEPDHNGNVPAFNEMCSNWEVDSIQALKNDGDITIRVFGRYTEFKGYFDLKFNAAGTLNVSYQFECKVDVNPRQWGMVFETGRDFSTNYWDRKGEWSLYPENHIGRTNGEAPLFYDGVEPGVDLLSEPTHPWSFDSTPMGSNDFRSTRTNIIRAGLKNSANNKIEIVSNGNQHWRTWLDSGKIQFLVAEFNTGGNELFLGSYMNPTRKPLKKGDKIQGEILILLK